MNQTAMFYEGEGNAWLKRNRGKLGSPNDDVVLHGLDGLIGVPRNGNYLEIGCANGWRLREIKQRYDATLVCGIDPSAEAVAAAKKSGVDATIGAANDLPWPDGFFNVVIYGFCLYLCDRKDLFKIVMEGDRVLSDGGLMIVYDFNADHPCRKPYKHKDGIWSYHQDYAKMFTANPAYTCLSSVSKQGSFTRVTILNKSIERGWPPCE